MLKQDSSTKIFNMVSILLEIMHFHPLQILSHHGTFLSSKNLVLKEKVKQAGLILNRRNSKEH